MTRDRDARIEQLFAEAVELPAPEREAFVSANAGDEETRREVLTLLAAHDSASPLDSIGDWLRSLEGAAGSSLSTDELLTRLGAALGHRYRIDREIARGGMAIVLQAEDLKHGRRVALKVLRPSLARGIGPERFLREISIAARLGHPHILPLHDSGEADGLLFYVMPFVDGESLRDRLRREKRLSLPDAMRVVRELAGALGYAHELGIVHRDIKPENIMFQAGQAVVGDFGIARAMSEAGGRTLTESGVRVGTPPYMSPEQVRAEADIDGRSDVYSLACILFEMLAGRPPFTGKSSATILKQHLEEAPPSLHRLAPDVPAGVGRAVTQALSKDPADRLPTPAAFVDALVAGSRARPGWRRLGLVGGLVAALTTIGGVIAFAGRDLARPAEASVMAILPLAAASADTGLARLGRDLVVTVSSNLDGVGEIRTVDALTVLAQTRESGVSTLDRGAALARRLGASTVAFGTIVREQSRVRVDLGLFGVDSIEPLVRGSVTADPDDLPALTDSLTWMLLRAVWRASAPPTPNVAAVTTQSVPALRAFLEGEEAGLAGRWDAAAEAYGRAMAADSTFWLAYWRYSYARWWYLEAVDDSVLGPLYEHRDALPERDRLVLESWWTDTIPVAIARGREAVERYPDYWPGWMQYADWLFHVGPVYGYERSEARAALENVVALNPSFTAAWEHLYWVTVATDPGKAVGALDALNRLGHGAATAREYGFDITRVYRLELAVARGAGLDSLLLDSIAHDLVTTARSRGGGGATLPGVQVAISRRALASNPPPPIASLHENLLAEALAARGSWAEALQAAERHASRVGVDPLDAFRYAVIGAWVGALPTDSAARLRAAAARAVSRAGASLTSRAELAWLDGLLAFAEGDGVGLADARSRVRDAGSESVDLLDRSLAALDRGLGGDVDGAAATLAALNWANPDVLAPAYDGHPYLIAVCRLTAARWYLASGREAEAIRPLMWFDAWWALDGYRPARRVLAGLSTLERARVAVLQGDDALARERYAEFLRRYDAPDPSQSDLTVEARQLAS